MGALQVTIPSHSLETSLPLKIRSLTRITCLQRLAEDSNPAIAEAATKTMFELKRQWEIEEGDSWRFMMNQNAQADNKDADDTESD